MITSSPINFGNVFNLTGNGSSLGPMINLNAALVPPTLNLQISAIVSLFAITQPIIINFDLARLIFPISGPISQGLLITDMTVESKYENFKNFNFNVTGNVRVNQDLLNLVQNVSNNISSLLTIANSTISAAQATVQSAQSNLNLKSASVCANVNETCKKKLCSNILCTFASFVVDQSCSLACSAAQTAFSLANITLQQSQTVLATTQNTFGAFAKAGAYVQSNVVTIFNIVNAGFNLNLNATNKDGYKAGISVNVNMVVLGQTYNVNVNFVFNDTNAIQIALNNAAANIINNRFGS